MSSFPIYPLSPSFFSSFSLSLPSISRVSFLIFPLFNFLISLSYLYLFFYIFFLIHHFFFSFSQSLFSFSYFFSSSISFLPPLLSFLSSSHSIPLPSLIPLAHYSCCMEGLWDAGRKRGQVRWRSWQGVESSSDLRHGQVTLIMHRWATTVEWIGRWVGGRKAGGPWRNKGWKVR